MTRGGRKAALDSADTTIGRSAPAGNRAPHFRYPEANVFFFLVFLAFVVARYIQINERMDILKTVRFEFLLGLASVIMAIAQMSSNRPDLGRSRHVLAGISLLFVCTITQIPFAADPPTAQMVFSDRVFKFSMLTFLIIVLVRSPRYMQWFIATFLFSIFYITLESTQGLISGGLVWENQGVMRLHGAVPIYTHPNSLGGVALGTLPFVLFLWSEWRRWYYRAAMLAASATSLVCVIYSGSRTAYVGLIGLTLWMFYVSTRKARFAVRMAVIGTLVIMVVPHQYIERFQSIGGHEKAGNSKNTRIEILRDAVTILAENPLGVGVASFPAKRTERFGRSQDTHNLYLEVATNLGVQGLLIFFYFVGAMLYTLKKEKDAFQAQLRRLAAAARSPGSAGPLRRAMGRHYRDVKFLVAVTDATGGFIAARLVVGLFGMDLYEIYWWFGAGITISLAGLVNRTRARSVQLLMALPGTDASEDSGPLGS